MMEFLFGGHMPWFTVPALIGTGLFVIRIVLMLTGGVGFGDVDGDVGDADVGHAGDGGDHSDSTAAFHLLSLQSVASFLMGYGWVGFAGMNTFDSSMAIALPMGVAGGAAFVWLMAILLKAAHDLQASGNISISDAVGLHGDVDLHIPARGAGRGRVRLVISNRLREFNAVTEGEEIARGVRVQVTRVQGNTLTVTSAGG